MREPSRRTELPRFGQPRRRGRARRDPLPPSLRPKPARAEPVATGRWSWPRRDAALPWDLVLSLLLHGLLVALLVLDIWKRDSGPPTESPAAVDVVFESGQPEPRATGAREGEQPDAVEPPSRAEAPPPTPEAPPVPDPPRLAEAPPPPPAPPRVAMAPPPPAPPLPQPPAALPLPPSPAPADLPSLPSELAPRLSAEIPPPEALLGDLLQPPTPLEITPPRVQPAPRPQPRPEPRPRPTQQAQPSPRLPGLYLPEGPSFTPPRPTPGRPLSPRAPLDLAVSPRLLEGRTSPDPSVQVRGAQVGPDWNAAFRRWLDQNLFYPIRAIEEGDSGTVRVRVTARPDGTVTGVRLTGASASPWLNSGTTRPFPGARLPPFPPGADPNGVEVDLTVRYILIRR